MPASREYGAGPDAQLVRFICHPSLRRWLRTGPRSLLVASNAYEDREPDVDEEHQRSIVRSTWRDARSFGWFMEKVAGPHMGRVRPRRLPDPEESVVDLPPFDGLWEPALRARLAPMLVGLSRRAGESEDLHAWCRPPMGRSHSGFLGAGRVRQGWFAVCSLRSRHAHRDLTPPDEDPIPVTSAKELTLEELASLLHGARAFHGWAHSEPAGNDATAPTAASPHPPDASDSLHKEPTPGGEWTFEPANEPDPCSVKIPGVGLVSVEPAGGAFLKALWDEGADPDGCGPIVKFCALKKALGYEELDPNTPVHKAKDAAIRGLTAASISKEWCLDHIKSKRGTGYRLIRP